MSQSTKGTPVESREVDVAVVGGGPAGMAAALALADAGRSVVVLEASRYEAVRVGESLPPDVRVPLTTLGVWDRFLADGPLAAPGIVSVWGSPSPRENDFVFHPFGPGWHVDRRQFDAMLARAARERGAEVLESARLAALERKRSEEWLLCAVVGDRTLELNAGRLVDASGRSPSPVRRLGGGRIVYDRLVGLIGFVEADPRDDHRTLVEAVEDGWWYSARLPQGQVVAAFMTDADLIAGKSVAWANTWRDRLRNAPYTGTRLGHRLPCDVRRPVLAGCSRLRAIGGDGWAAVGDAGAALDPLSGLGVYRALESGRAAALAIDADLRGDAGALPAYARQVVSDYTIELNSWRTTTAASVGGQMRHSGRGEWRVERRRRSIWPNCAKAAALFCGVMRQNSRVPRG